MVMADKKLNKTFEILKEHAEKKTRAQEMANIIYGAEFKMDELVVLVDAIKRRLGDPYFEYPPGVHEQEILDSLGVIRENMIDVFGEHH
jgi:hypothetical protein